jgi:hypothetical protein
MPTASSPKTQHIFQMVSTWLSQSFWQNLMQYHCTSRFVIFAENNNATHAGCTRLMLSADRKNPRKQIKIPYTTIPQLTSHALLFSAEKNHAGYFLNRPHI